jgi:predicted MFS family arabinose efflux permease
VLAGRRTGRGELADRRGAGVLAAANIALLLMSLGVVAPLLPGLADQMHSTLYAGLLSSAYPLGTLVATVPMLVAARRWGLPRTIAVGGLIGGAASLLFIWPGVGWWLVVSRFAFGLTGVFVWQSIFAWVTADAGAHRRARGIGILLAAASAGGIVAPQLGAFAGRVGLWFCALPCLALLVGTAWLALVMPRPEPVDNPDLAGLRAALGSRDVATGMVFATITAFAGAFNVLALLLAVGARGVGAAPLGVALSAVAAGQILVNLVAGRIADRGLLTPLIAVASALTAAATAAMVVIADGGASLLLLGVAETLNLGLLAIITLVTAAVVRAGLDQTWSQALAGLAIGLGGMAGAFAAGAVSSLDARLILSTLATAIAGAVGAYASRRDERTRACECAVLAQSPQGFSSSLSSRRSECH